MISLEAFVYPRQSPFLIPMNMYNVEIQAINNNIVDRDTGTAAVTYPLGKP